MDLPLVWQVTEDAATRLFLFADGGGGWTTVLWTARYGVFPER
jgi:hypothetical protein